MMSRSKNNLMFTTCTELVQLKQSIINVIILWVIYAQMSTSDKALRNVSFYEFPSGSVDVRQS